MKKILFQFSLLLFIISNCCFSQSSNIEINYSRPPLNQLNANNLWDFTLVNTSSEDLEFFLYGTLTEKKAGQIANGTTVPIKLKKGEVKKFKVSDLPQTPDINYVHPDGRYKEALIRAGNLPEGDYEICVTAKSAGTGEELGKGCAEQEISQSFGKEIMLLTPENGTEISKDETVIFSWMMSGIQKEDKFIFEIYEMSGQNPEEAVNSGTPFYKTETRQPNITYKGPKFQEGKKYVWLVRSGSSKSNVNTFMFSSSCRTLEVIDSIKCDLRNPGKYTIKIIFNNPSSWCVMTINSITIPSGFTFTPALPAAPFVVNTGSAITYTGSLTTTGALNGNLVTNATSSTNNTDNYTNNLILPSCACCQNFKVKISNPTVTGSGTGYSFSSGIATAGGPYTKVTTELVYFALTPMSKGTFNDTCLNCTKDSKLMGNFTGGSLADFSNGELIGPSAAGFSRGINFHSSASGGTDMSGGKKLKINFLGPDIKTLACCSFKMYYCIRFSFTDANCQTCDTLICGEYEIKPRGQSPNINEGPKGGGEKNEAGIENIISEQPVTYLSKSSIGEDNCNKEECKTTDVNISTGFNHNTGTIYNNNVSPAVDQDPYWILTGAPSDPNYPVNLNTPAWVIKKDGAWTNMPNSAYIAPFKNCSTNLNNKNESTAPFTFSRCFCMCTNGNINLKFDLRADNWARVLLDGIEIASFGTPPANNMGTGNFQGSPISVDTSIFLSSGKHCLEVELRNDGTVSMGFCLKGTISSNSNLFLTPACCDPSSYIIGTKYWDKNCNGKLESDDEKIPGLTINLYDESGNLINTSVTDAEGQYVFNNLNAGTYSVAEQQLENCKFSQPSNGKYENVTLLANEVKNLDFLNCCDGKPEVPKPIDCCKDFKTKIETENFSAWQPNPEATVFSFTPKFTVGPNPVRKVSMVMEYMNVSYEDKDCYVCAPNALSYGNFICNTESAKLGNIKASCPVNIWGIGIGREIVWGNNSTSIDLTSGVITGDVINLLFPPSSRLSCCKPKFEFCIRYRFTDINCKTCDTLICYTIENGKLNPPPRKTERKGSLKHEDLIKIQKEVYQNSQSK